MTKRTLSFVLSLVFILTLNVPCMAQTPTITLYSGPDTVCSNSLHTYSEFRFPTISDDSVSWIVERGSIALSVGANSKTILWGGAGVGKVKVLWYSNDSTRTFLDSAVMVVIIKPLPNPSISTDTRVACEPLDEPGEGVGLGPFVDSGCQRVCAYDTVVYTANGNPSSTYYWPAPIGGGIIGPDNQQTCTILWMAPGPGKMFVQETSPLGCVGETTQCINITESPIAHFVALPDTNLRTINVCMGTEVIFLDYSIYSQSAPIVAWRWDFGDGKFSNEKGSSWMPISHIYEAGGTYTASLTVTNECGCSTTETMIIEVEGSPGVEIICPSLVCENSSYQYSVDAACSGGTWQVIGGTVTPLSASKIEVKWDNVDPSGFGYIIFDPGGCPGYCVHPVAKKIPVLMANGTINGEDFLCVNKQYLYSMPQWPTTRFNWSVSPSTGIILQNTDQPNEIILTPGTAAGTVTLTCDYDNTLLGCTGTASKTISIPGPVTLSGPTRVCQGGDMTYNLTGPNAATGQWSLLKPDNSIITGSGSGFSALFDYVGIYMLTVTGNFCPPEPLEIKVIPPPPPPDNIYGPERLCRGVPTEYVAGTIDAANIFGWRTPDGRVNIAAGEKCEVIINHGATEPFEVFVWRETKEFPHCKSDEIKKDLYLPYVVFSVSGEDTVCPSAFQQYEVNYLEGEAYDWKIYPEYMGSVVSGQSTKAVNILWNTTPGNAKVVCKIRKCYAPNNEYTDTLDVHVRSIAVQLTLPDTICLWGQVHAEISNAGGGVVWYNGVEHFDAEDGETDITWVYNTPMINYTTYNVIATVKQPFGCNTQSEAYGSIVVAPAPIVSVTPHSYTQLCDGEDGLPIDFDIITTWDTSGVPPVSYVWTQNNTYIGTDSTVHVSDTGNVFLNAYSANGCASNHEVTVFLRDCTHRSLTGEYDPSCNKWALLELESMDCGLLTFKGKHSSSPTFDHGGWPTSWKDSLERVSYTDSSAIFRVLKAGAYNFYYQATFNDLFTCRPYDDTTIVIPIVPDLDIELTCDTNSFGERGVKLINRTTSMVPYTFNIYASHIHGAPFCSGTGYQECTIYLPPNTSNIAFRLTVYWGTNGDSCVVDTSMSIAPIPRAHFVMNRDTACEKDAFVYFDNTSDPPASNLHNHWYFGDGAENNAIHPSRVYNAPNTGGYPYTVKLEVRDRWGCMDSTSQTVMVKTDQLDGNVSVSPTYPCEHNMATVTYNNFISSTLANHFPFWYEWYDADANITTGPANYLDIFKSGYYYTEVTDQYGCYHTTDADTVLFVKAPRAYIYGNDQQCEHTDYTMSGYAGQLPGLIYTWLRGGSIISGATGAEFTDNQTAGSYTYRLITSMPNPSGGFCSDTSDDFVVTVHATPDTPQVSFDIPVCDDYTISLVVSPAPAGDYNWSNGMYGSSILVNHGGPYQVRYTDLNGCVSKASIKTPRDLRVYLWIFPTGCYSLCDTNPAILTGPIIPFGQWDYRLNGSPVVSTSGYFYDYNLNATGAGVYTMFLANEWCEVTSREMDVDFDCTPFGPGSAGERFANGASNLVTPLPQLQLAPNPATVSVNVNYSYAGDGPCYIELYDAVGRRMFGKELVQAQGRFDMAVGDYPAGVYQIIMRRGRHILQHRALSITR